MTPKERWLAALRLRPVDRLPFWPKLNAAYRPACAAPFDAMNLAQIHEFIGSDRHEHIPSCVEEVRTRTSLETTTHNGIRRLVYTTPAGTATAADRFDDVSQSWHPIQHPIKTVDDIRVMTEFYTDVRCELNRDALAQSKRAHQELGSDAVTANSIGESPLMHFVEWLAGVEKAHLLLHDYRREVDELFEAIQRVLVRRAALVCENSLADLIYLTENTSTTLISPAQFRAYCAKHIADYGRIAREAGKLFVLHMCGHLKAILPDLAKLPADAFEAFTSPPVGNTRLIDGRTACPNTCLIGGTNAVLWTRPAREIIAEIERDLDALPHHRGLVITSGGVMPPICEPEVIREVAEWVRNYPARM